MSARDMLDDLAERGVTVRALPDGMLKLMPFSVLSDADKAAIRAHKVELLALLGSADTHSSPPVPLSTSARKIARPPHRPTHEQAERCHEFAWTDTDIARFVDRRARLQRWGWTEPEAAKLAERLGLRDRADDERVSCADCGHYRPGRCGNHRAAGLTVADVGRGLATLLQRCPGFASCQVTP